MATASFTTPGTPLTMAALKTFLDAALGELLNRHRGASAPDSPVEGQLWWDTSGDPVDTLKRYTVAAGWISLLTVNKTTGAVTIQSLTLKKVITSTRDMTAGSGDVAYSGVGFKPSLIIFQGAVDAHQVAGWGVVDAASKHYVSYDNLGNYYQAGPGWAFLIVGGSAYQGAQLKTFDADGFTLTWTKSGNPSGTIKFSATCFR